MTVAILVIGVVSTGAAVAGKIESVAPAASVMGVGWERDTDALIEDVSKPPKPPKDSPEARMAHGMLTMGLPLLASKGVAGIGNFSYYHESPDGFSALDVYISRYKGNEDAQKALAERTKDEGQKPYEIGDEGRIAEVVGTKVLNFCRANYTVKIIVIGASDSELEKLAGVVDANIRNLK